MSRVTVNLTADTVGLLKTRAKAEDRTVSSFIEILIEQDLRAAGLLPPKGEDDAKFHEQLNRALDADPELKPKIERLTRTALRQVATAKG